MLSIKQVMIFMGYSIVIWNGVSCDIISYDIFLSINTTFDICLFFFSVVLDNLANLSVDEDKNKQPAEVQRNTSDEK